MLRTRIEKVMYIGGGVKRRPKVVTKSQGHGD